VPVVSVPGTRVPDPARKSSSRIGQRSVHRFPVLKSERVREVRLRMSESGLSQTSILQGAFNSTLPKVYQPILALSARKCLFDSRSAPLDIKRGVFGMRGESRRSWIPVRVYWCLGMGLFT
jgi:hypothetical protein